MGAQTAPAPSTFGALLRDLRERAGLTQEELAERAGLTAYAVSALERGRRSRPYPHTVRSLAEALQVEPQDRAALVAAVPRRAVEPAGPAADASPERRPTAPRLLPERTVLPAPVARLVGREADVRAVVGLVEGGARLVTVTGPGGVGKTRLATAVAAELAGGFPDGAVLVPLAPLTDPTSVLPAVSRALGAGVGDGPGLPERLVELLRPTRSLLVLDNLEHLLDAAGAVVDLVEACPGLVVLVTSRAPLRVRGEVEHLLAPLGLPTAGDVESVRAAPAVEVLLERARAVSPSFAVTAGNAAAVAALSSRLAGLPLALELAAARLRFLDPQALLDRLDEAMAGAGSRDLPARQQSLRATFDWSYELLAPAEQRLLRVLSVFHGGCTLEAVEQVCAGSGGCGDVLPLLEVLVEHSLVTVTVDGDGPRYGMLEPVRQHALSRTGEDERVALLDAHARCYRDLAERAAPEYLSGGQVDWLSRIEREDANVEAALSWSLSRGDGETAGRTGWALWLDWWMRGRLEQGRRHMERALACDLPPLVQARTTLVAACMAFAAGDLDAAETSWRRVCELAVSLDEDPVVQGQGRAGVGLVDLARGDAAAAGEAFAEALPHLDVPGDRYADWLTSLVQVWLGTVRLLGGDVAGAREHAGRGLASARRRKDRLTSYVALFTLSQAAIVSGDHALAREHLQEGLRLTVETRDLANLAYFLEALAVVEAGTGSLARVPVLVGAAEGVRELVGGEVYGYYQPDPALLAGAVTASRAALGDDAYDDALDGGRALSADEALRLGLPA